MCAIDFRRVVGFGWSPGFRVWVVGVFRGLGGRCVIENILNVSRKYNLYFFLLSPFFFLPEHFGMRIPFYASVILAVIKNLRYPLLLAHTFRRYATLRDAMQMWVNF